MSEFPATPRTLSLIVSAQRCAQRSGVPLVLTAGGRAYMAVTGKHEIDVVNSEQRRAELRAAIEKAARDKSARIITGRDREQRRRSGIYSTVRNPGGRVGRNEPCPCGSGKKFKRCCLKG